MGTIMTRLARLTIALAVFLLVALLSPALLSAAETVVVRDAKGKVIERHVIKGDRKEIRSPSGKLIRYEIRKKDRIEVRDPSGRLIQTKKLQ